jgi:hypothetical protein
MTSVSIISRLLRQSGATEAPLKLPCHEAPAFRGRPGRPGQRMCVLVVRLEAYPCYIKRISRPALPYPSGDCGMAGPSPHDGRRLHRFGNLILLVLVFGCAALTISQYTAAASGGRAAGTGSGSAEGCAALRMLGGRQSGLCCKGASAAVGTTAVQATLHRTHTSGKAGRGLAESWAAASATGSSTPQAGVAAPPPAPPAAQQQAPEEAEVTYASWQTLVGFLRRCDRPAHAPMGEVLGFDAAAAGVGAAAGAPRNQTRVIQALHAITASDGTVAAEPASCVVCPPGPTQTACRRAAHSTGAATSPRIGELMLRGYKGSGTGVAAAPLAVLTATAACLPTNAAQCPLTAGILMISSGAPGHSQLSEANKRAYATRHGYGLHILPPGDASRHPAWSKVRLWCASRVIIKLSKQTVHCCASV